MGVTGVGRGTASNEYELLAPLAEGGMAEIFLARARGLAGMERYVVLKRILRAHAADPRWVEMFLDEARLAARLHHPNIAQVFDLGQIDDTYFFTMEYVHGQDLRTILRRAWEQGLPIPIGLLLGAVSGAAAGLAYAHELCDSEGSPLGIVHRDVSPSNVLVSYDGGIKLVDFGVAKATLRDSKTASGAVKGKIAYLSPEQCQNHPLDARTDVFSLGIVLWELCTGTRLYKRESDFDEMNAIITEPAVAPSILNETLPPGLDEVVLTALAKRPSERFASARAMQEALESVAERAGISHSANVLRRQLLELVGPREEPWRNLAKHVKQTLTIAQGTNPTAVGSGSGSDVAPLRVFSVHESSAPSASGVAQPIAEPAPTQTRPKLLMMLLVGLAIVGTTTMIAVLARGSSSDTPRDPPMVEPLRPIPPPPVEPRVLSREPEPPRPPPDAAVAPADAAVAPADASPPIKRPPPPPPPRPVKKPPKCTDPLDCQF